MNDGTPMSPAIPPHSTAPDPTYTRGRCATPGVRMLSLVILALVLLAAGGRAETAYSALRALGAQRGDAILSQVIEIRGDGARDPATWTIVVVDRQSTAGVREIEVGQGRITGEHPPQRPPLTTTPMNLSLLNLDSEGAVSIVDLETPARSATERIDYRLSSGRQNGTPVWTLTMQPPRAGTAGTMEVAADTGDVLTPAPSSGTDREPGATQQIPPGETRPAQPAIATNEGEPSDPAPPTTKRRSPSSSTRDGIEPVPDAVRTVVKQVKKPIRFLRRFVP